MSNSSPEERAAADMTNVETPFIIKEDLTSRVASGAVWSGAARVCLQLLYLASVAVLARKLDPEAYGLMNMTQIAIGFVSLFRDIGIGSAVIQKREIDNGLLSSLCWIAIGLGCVATLACFVVAPLIAAFYKQPLVTSMLRVLAFSFAISSVTTVHEALLNRQMAFRKLAVVEVGAAFVALAVAVVFAYSGQGVWSLVAASLTSSVVSSAGFILAYRWIPAFRFSWRDVRSVTGFGMHLSGFNLVNYFSRNADNVLIGRYLGTTPLGFYQFAYAIMLYPVQNVAQLLGRVLFPAFSEIQQDRPRIRNAYIRSCAIIALISFPLMAGVAAVSRPFVLVWMGPKWLPVAALIAILAPVGMFQAVGTTVGQIYMAVGRTDLMFKWGLIASPLTVLSFVVGLPWGVRGVAISYAIVMALLAYPLFLIPSRLIDLSIKELWIAVQPIVVAAGLMFVTVEALERSIRWMQPLYVLTICIAVGAATYFVCIRIFASELLDEVRAIGQKIYAGRLLYTWLRALYENFAHR